jgi:hypothetical protein
VSTDGGKTFAGNALRFETRKEAEENVDALALRWTLVHSTCVDESTDPVNYRYIDGQLIAVTKENN